MADKSFKIINSSVLIAEIKRHPVLYDAKLSNGNPELKKQSWEEVAMALFEERWAKFTPPEKDALVREIQVKWKSLRDNFTRVLRKEKEDEQAGIPPGKKKKYMYYDQLMFLMPFTSFRKSSSNMISSNNTKDPSNGFSKGDNKSFARSIPNVIYLDESKESNDSMQYNMSSDENPLQTSASTMNSVPPLRFIQIQPSATLPIGTNVTTIQSASQHSEEDETSSSKRIASVLEEVVALQKEEKTDDPMGNRKFLLSLLPFMRKLPDDVNLEVRLQLMSVLQAYNSGKSFL